MTTAKNKQPSPWALPFGWVEVPAGRHPHDVHPGEDITKVVNGAGEIVGHMRKEHRRWQRGRCVVRLVEIFDDDSALPSKFAVHYFDARKPKSSANSYSYGHDAADDVKCLQAVWELMALGGRP